MDVVAVGRERYDGQLIRLRHGDLFPVKVVVAVCPGNGAVVCAGEHARWWWGGGVSSWYERRREEAEGGHDASRNRG